MERVKTCSTCRKEKPLKEFHYTHRDGFVSQCKACRGEVWANYYTKNRKKEILRTKQYKKGNVQWTKEVYKKKTYCTTVRLRIECINGYGGRCMHCGEDFSEVLVLHHTKEPGAKTETRKTLGNSNSNMFYKWVIENHFPKGVIVLCANCHLLVHRGYLTLDKEG